MAIRKVKEFAILDVFTFANSRWGIWCFPNRRTVTLVKLPERNNKITITIKSLRDDIKSGIALRGAYHIPSNPNLPDEIIENQLMNNSLKTIDHN